jgi:DNA-directed RNA polymerase specialized sigma24 family protein
MRTRRSRAIALNSERICSAGADLDEPGRLITCNEELRLLSSALAELPDEQREVIVLHIHGQMRFRIIAKSSASLSIQSRVDTGTEFKKCVRS